MTDSKKVNNFILYSATFLFLLCSGFVIEHHELWRDEMAAYLLSRDSLSVVDLFKNVRYEGHSVFCYGLS